MRCVSARRPSPTQDFQSRLTMTWMQPKSFRFLAPLIADAINGKYFNRKRKLGMLDPEFLNRVNGTMVCLTCAILCHQLCAYRLGVHQDPPDFKPDAVGGRRPSMSPRSLVFVLMTNQSGKTISYGRRTPGGQYHGQRSNSCSGICLSRLPTGSSKIIVSCRKVVKALLTIMTQFMPNWSFSYPGVSYPAGIQHELLCGKRHRSRITPGV